MTRDQVAARLAQAADLEVKWSPTEVRSIYASAQRDLLAERQAANRFCVMEARTSPDGGTYLGHCVVDLQNGTATQHTDADSAWRLRHELTADETDRLLDEWEAER